MNPFKILMVEDEVLIADNIKKFLIDNGHEVVGTAISYEEAIELYEACNPDIALLDIRLNGTKSGIDVASFIRQQANPIPFIFLTSQVDKKNLNKVKDTFPAGYLSKPIQKNSLIASLEIAMHQHMTLQEREVTIPLYDGNRNHLIPIDSILYVESEHVYSKVYLKNGTCIIQRSPLKELLTHLPGNQFIRTHRSFIINVKHISRWDIEYIYIQDNKIPVSRSRRKEVSLSLKLD